jgi:hypothetical protein
MVPDTGPADGTDHEHSTDDAEIGTALSALTDLGFITQC